MLTRSWMSRFGAVVALWSLLATLSGGTSASAAAPGLLRVTQALTTTVRTQILVDGQIADSWGLNWLKEAPGAHTVCFTHVEGWTEPPCQTVTVNGGATTTVTGSFTQRGELHVFTSPAVASQITLDGNPTDDWGMFTDVPTGVHAVCYGKVANFDPPACQNVTVNAGALTTTTGTFTSHPGALGQSGVGLLRVMSSPAVPTQISIKPGAGSPYIADSWGLTWLELAPGSYTVSFSHVEGWTEPAPQTVTITAGNTTVVTGTFTQRGILRVTTSPRAAGTISVDGIPRNDWGMWTDIPTGSHMVCFGPADGFATNPPCQTVTVNPGVETDVTGTYSPPAALAFGPEPSTTARGAHITPSPAVHIVDSSGRQTNSTATVTLTIGTNPAGGTLSGTTTVAASAGIATFPGLSIDKVGSGYTLTASSPGLLGATSTAFDVVAGTWSTTARMATARSGHTATLLSNGKVLVVGGAGITAELYDPATGTWSTTGSMAIGRGDHTATLLPTGKVLVAGGSGSASAELYDPASGSWSTTGSMAVARSSHTATLLSNGKVLVTGGNGTGISFPKFLASAELYDPATGTWSMTGSMAAARYQHTATLLVGGKVLVAAGCCQTAGRGGVLDSAELYDPATGTWSTTGSLLTNRASHTGTLLSSGKVLVAGGWMGNGTPSAAANAETYDPATGSWSTTGTCQIGCGRWNHTATLLSNGTVLVAGGFVVGSPGLASAALYDAATGTWSPTGDMTAARYMHTASLLSNGMVLVSGGLFNNVPVASAELYSTAP